MDEREFFAKKPYLFASIALCRQNPARNALHLATIRIRRGVLLILATSYLSACFSTSFPPAQESTLNLLAVNNPHHLTPQEIQDEYRLIEAAQKNRRCFDKLYLRYHEQIFRYIIKRVDNEEVASDLCSGVFLKAMEKLPSYRFQGVPFSAWLYRVASNEVNQHFRQAKKMQRTISLDSGGIAELMEEIEEPRYTQAHVQSLVSVLQKLSPQELEMVELRYFEQLSHREVAVIFEITETTAKTRMSRLKDKMRKIIGQSPVEVP
jgi:RNA polymerase sigma-70 factor, ECF subfamily